MTRTLLFDGNNLAARADFAAKGKAVAMSSGEVNTAALVIYINMIAKYVRLVDPTHIAVMWDAGHAMRDEIYPEYKANRAQHIEGTDTVPYALIKEFLTWAGIPHKSQSGWEADDLIAATARQCYDDVAIVSGDKDLLQLLRDPDNMLGLGQTVQYRIPDDTPWTVERYEAQYGCPPQKASYVHALVGDASDHVPGVPGLGPKKAVALLGEAGWDWEALLDLLGPERAAQASTMRALVDLRDLEYPAWFMEANKGVPQWHPTVYGEGMLGEALANFCENYELKSIIERLRTGTMWIDPRAAQTSLFEGV